MPNVYQERCALTGKNKTDKQIDKIKAYLFSIFNSLNNLNEKIVIIRFKEL